MSFEPSDRRLMEEVRRDDEDAFQQLIDRHWPGLIVYVERIVCSRADAKDVAQETFIRAWGSRDRWTPETTVAAWLYRIARNAAIDQKRSAQRRTVRENTAHALMTPDDPPGPHDVLVAGDLRARIERAVDALPERRREIFLLSRFHGLTHREIADALEISPQTVSNQMTAALKELRERLADLVRGC